MKLQLFELTDQLRLLTFTWTHEVWVQVIKFVHLFKKFLWNFWTIESLDNAENQ